VTGWLSSIFGDGKDDEPQDVTPEQMPAYTDEFAPVADLLGQILLGVLGDENFLTGEALPEGFEFGAEDIGPAGQEGLERLRGHKMGYDWLPEESLAYKYGQDVLGGGMRERGLGRLADIEEKQFALGEKAIGKGIERIRGKYAGGGQMYSAAPMAEGARVAGDVGQALAESGARRGLEYEKFATGEERAAAGGMVGLGAQRGDRGIRRYLAEMSPIRELIKTGALQSTLKNLVQSRKMGEHYRAAGQPLDRLSRVAQILSGAGRPGQGYWPMQEPSELSRSLEAGGGFYEMLMRLFGGDGGGGGAAEERAWERGGAYNPATGGIDRYGDPGLITW
jgi:hypothetical protein